ncbi:MFS transporter [Novosphingobium sp. MMS21-SN21R]|uniref:MFS transporter n=1 Tax=Novosphingobium sp. MMS21-SN21R TaxID=2969298 RepID=UPI0028886DF3|nr:MFS transporter [Novosphingobium sp. MMS21-SN21R]MDT0507303.1 MFS transporter [Novosphingobium sp. MMS21-SN21R]
MPQTIDGMTGRQKSLAFFTLITALVLEIVDVTIINTALPAMQTDFAARGQDLGGGAAQWIAAGYSLAFGLLLLLGGRLGDLFGGRAMFLLGVSGFTLASAMCGLAISPETLIAARVAQGASGAIMAPQVMAVIQILYDPVERIGRLAWFGVIGGLAGILGPILGGLLIAADVAGLGWRSVFLINLPIGLAALAAGWRYLPREVAHKGGRIDLIGTLAFGAALAAMLFPLVRGEHAGFDGVSIAILAASPLLMWAAWRSLVRRARTGGPVIFPPELGANRLFRTAASISLVFSAANTGFLFVFAHALQARLGYSPLQTGLVHIPFSAGVMIGMGFLGRRYLAKAGKWVMVCAAVALLIADGAALGWIAAGGPGLPLLIPALLLAGIGMGTLSGPATPVALARVDRAHAGAASGILKTVMQMGGAFGIALIGSAYFSLNGPVAASGPDGMFAAIAVIEVLLTVCLLLALSLPAQIFPAKPASQASQTQ